MDPPASFRNRSGCLRLAYNDLDGLGDIYLGDIDIFNVVIIGIGGPDYANYQGVVEMLDVLLSNRYSAEKKLDVLQHKFGIKLTPDILKGVQEVYKFSQYIFDKGKAEGEAKGEAKTFNLLTAIGKKVREGLSIDEAMALLNVPEEQRPSCRAVFAN